MNKQAKDFIQEICIGTWGMSSDEVEKYCQMIVKQNLLMGKLDKEYLKTAKAYEPFAGLKKYEN